MDGSHPPMLRVSALNRCPICGHGDWCMIKADGTMAICPRTAEGAVKDLGEAGYLHVVHPDHVTPHPAPHYEPPNSVKVDFKHLSDIRRERAEPRLHDLSRTLGVSVDALRCLKVGYNDFDKTFTFPERDGQGNIIGILLRYPTGPKKRIKGSKSGLSYADAWDDGVGPVFAVEGPSDTAALMTLGLKAIGRPSNRGGYAHLADLLSDFPEDRNIIILGDNDCKEDGFWPGKEGAIQTASEVSKRLERTVYWALPPDGVKDARAWLNEHGGDNPVSMRDCFLEGLHLHAITPPPVIRSFVPFQEPISLGSYRQEMLKRRLLSLDRPGIYLDRSMTGSGKSAIDYRVVLNLFGRTEEVA
ncbi:toprim domain-containing protein [uncultured Rubinisphaera sp.]|uniref:toprim domain-containing protein n=1 Tax=uncultured Rubinisphaera sp. TaxID=1678686 RepID=UPI0030DCB55D